MDLRRVPTDAGWRVAAADERSAIRLLARLFPLQRARMSCPDRF